MTFTRFSCWELARPFLRIWHSHLHAACANHYTQRLNTKESAQVSQDIFIFIYKWSNTLHKLQLYKYTRKDMVLVSSSPYPGVVLCQTLPVVSVTDSFVTTQAPPFSSPQNDPSPSSSPTPPSPQLAPPPAQCTCRTEVSPQVHLSPAIFSHGPCTTCTCICRSALSPLRFPRFSSAPHLTLLYPQMHLLLCCKQNQEQHQK